MKITNHPIIAILIATLVICQAAFYNGFPLVYSDTGTYIFSGHEMTLPIDRPILYGLFIKFSSLGISLWLTIFIQAFLLSNVLYLLVNSLFENNQFKVFMTLILVLSFLTSMSWYSSQLMPDIFSAMSILVLYLLLISKGESVWYQGWLVLLFVFSVNVHYSNLLIMIGVASMIGVWYWKKRKLEQRLKINFRFVGIVFVITIIAPFIINYSVAKTFKSNQGSSVFLMGRMLDNGVLKSFLDDNCPQKNYVLCSCKEDLPENSRELLWSPDSPVHKLGGWTAIESEFNAILTDLFLSPKHSILFAMTSFTATFSQLLQNDVGSGLISDWYASPDSPPHYAIATHYSRELNQYEQSRQNKNLWGQGLDFSTINFWNSMLLFISLVVLVLFITSKALWNMLTEKSKLLIYIILSGIFFNAFITGSLANVYDRLQARVSWLLILLALILLIPILRELISMINKKVFQK
jgi:hypothetical protein